MRAMALKLFATNDELRGYLSRSSHLQTAKERRAAVSIAVIDDEPFAPQANLQTYGYNIKPIGDLKDLNEVASFHMVLCDVMGVGRHFDAKLQGASLIAEIKKSYPEKVVIAYTGAAMNDRAAKLATERADRIIKKDVDIEQWTAVLDELGREAVDPYVIWNKVRRRFVEIDASTKDILALEDAYVRAVRSRDASFSLLTTRANEFNVQKDVRAIVQGIASSYIFNSIFGAGG